MKVEVLVITRPNLRDREFTVFVGQQFLKQLFDTEDDLTETESVTLEFPERWLNILELRALLTVISFRCPKLQYLFILTANEYLLSTCLAENVKVFSENEAYPEIIYRPGVRYCPLPEKSPLYVFHG